MRIHRGKYLFFFFILLMICSQIVRAQDKMPGKISIAKPDVPLPEIDNPAPLPQPSIVVNNPGKIVRPVRKKEVFETPLQPAVIDLEFDFRAVAARVQNADFRGSGIRNVKKPAFQMPPPLPPLKENKKPEDDASAIRPTGFNWRGALSQSFVFLGIQHGFAIISQEKTRRSLKGKFWSDYVDSVKALRGWDDGGRFFTNYVAHPMQGSFTGFIYVQNSPQARRARFGMSRDYWSSRMKAMLWTAVWSTQFEIGPISQASIGNVGLGGKQTWEDIVTTPTLGTAMLIAEDAIDRYVIRSIERRWDNFYVKIFSRMLLNPTRIFANMLRLKAPWYRDRPTAR